MTHTTETLVDGCRQERKLTRSSDGFARPTPRRGAAPIAMKANQIYIAKTRDGTESCTVEADSFRYAATLASSNPAFRGWVEILRTEDGKGAYAFVINQNTVGVVHEWR